MAQKPRTDRARKLVTLAAAGLALAGAGVAVNSYRNSEESRLRVERTQKQQLEAEAAASRALTAKELKSAAGQSPALQAAQLYRRFAPSVSGSKTGADTIAFLVKSASPAGGRLGSFAFLKQVHLNANAPKSQLRKIEKKIVGEKNEARLDQLTLLSRAISFVHERRPENRKAVALVRDIQKSRLAGEFLLELDRLNGESKAAKGK